MYTGDTTSSVSLRNTKSTIEALLRNKEQCPIITKPAAGDFNTDKGFWSNYSATSDFDFEGIPQNLERNSKNQASPDHVSNSDSQENLEQKDFNYSQKLFHIADGNLYSIFSPIQGRSYGMKPSFLRKQKYTVQECHNRGRKNLRKGLKFHNFLPSESVTSEKDSGYLNPKWKVYSECRLREEHGTKQITISNWSQSVQNPPAETATTETTVSSPSPATETNCLEPPLLIKSENENEFDCKTEPSVNDPYDFQLNTSTYESHDENGHLNLNKARSEAVEKCLARSSSKKDSLNILLNSLIQKPFVLEKNNCSDETEEIQNRSFQKRRRKPVQTRRIVPYVKYLSIMEENETLPLDLSSKCFIENSSTSTVSYEDSQNFSGSIDFDFSTDDSFICDKNVKNTISNYVSLNNNLPVSNISTDKEISNSALKIMMQNKRQIPATFSYPFPFNKNTNHGQNALYPPPLLGPASSQLEIKAIQSAQTTPVNKSYNVSSHSLPNNSQFSVQKSFVKEVQSKPRRRNQRSAIKQKLEDTFRQNGFLVKTKQVSDGEATFCKFRQLRKYTRYYLKSLEQHLPDEFNKMWKGFLPPKTVMPSVSGTADRSNESSI